MSEVFEYPLGAIIAAIFALAVSILTIWATLRRERRDTQRARKEAVEAVRQELKEYVRIKLEYINVRIDNIKSELKQMQFFIENSDNNEEENSSP